MITPSAVVSGGNHTFAPGSLIIPMDDQFQNNGAFLGYGLVYQLLKVNVPVSWVIKVGKRESSLVTTPGGASEAGTTATYTTAAAHALAVGDVVVVAAATVAGYNGTLTVTSVPSATTFQVTLAASGLAASGSSTTSVATVTPADFTASATDRQTSAAVASHAYRGGPFVIDSADVTGAVNTLVTAWQTANPTTTVHVATTSFTGFVKRELIAAPTIAMFADGNQGIAQAYLNAAKIPDSQGNAWPSTSPDLLTPAQVAGSSCDGVSDCIASKHNDGALFDANGVPKYCQMMSMHWDRGCKTAGCTACTGASCTAAQSVYGREVVREYRSFLQSPTHLFTECQAANAVENNSNPGIALAASPNGASESGTTATFTTTVAHGFTVGQTIGISGVGVAGYNGIDATGWVVTSVPSPTKVTVTLPVSGLAASGGGTAATYNGLFLTTTGYIVDTQPNNVDSFNFDQPFAQFDGPFRTTGGSEPGYSLPALGTYKSQDVVMLTQHGTPQGVDDVWMTGFLDGKCQLTSEFCDPSFSQGKVSVLAGHDYGTSLPISGGSSAGTRLFLNALLEAPCATDVGAAALDIFKSGPLSTTTNQATYTIRVTNPGSSTASGVLLKDTLAAGVSFVACPGSPACSVAGQTVTWNLGNLAGNVSTAVQVTVQFASPAVYSNSATATFKAGVTTFTAASNTASTCFYAGDPSICGTGCDPNAPKCGNNCDDDGDGLIDFPDDPGCDSATDDDETDVATSSQVKGRVLIVMDTSGSLEWNTCGDGTFTGGDGSKDCPGADVACATCGTAGCGNGLPDDTRLAKMKLCVSNVLNGFGEVEYALMRFTQTPVPFTCGTSNVNRNDGGWQGAGGSPCTGFNSGDLLVRFSRDNQNDMLKWLDGSTNYLASPPPAGKDFELRASGNTPLAGALSSAKGFVDATRSADPPSVASCRPYKVILVTDGAETCAGDPVAAASALSSDQAPVFVIGFSTPDPTIQGQLNAIAAAGGTSHFTAADDEVQLSAALEQIIQSTILTEKCNNLDDDCDGAIDEDFPNKGQACTNGKLGACAAAGVFACTADQSSTACTAGSGAPPQASCPTGKTCNADGSEVCNDGTDNDCDGRVDEGCTVCVPVGEICNGKDDDCDGKIDEDIGPHDCGFGACNANAACCGTQTCVNGAFTTCSATPPSAESCNGVDDDCDGTIDEDLSVGCSDLVTPNGPASDNPGDASHAPIAQNLCHPGTKACTNGAFGACTGEQKPAAEICDALDNDCDNVIDEDTGGGTCTSTCGVGTIECTAGTLKCTAQPVTGDTSCDGVDDDCDGRVDEDWVCGDPNANPFVPCACTAANACGGQNKCVSGHVQCAGTPIDPASCCDCNGAPLSTDPCGGGTTCAANCQCAAPCGGGEFPCPNGKKCVADLCVADPCADKACPPVNGSVQTCIDNGNNTASCMDTCSLTTCGTNAICLGTTGECAPNDCTTFPAMCAADQHCLVDSNGSASCVTDPCAGVACPDAQYCEAGLCVASCAGVTCATGEVCQLGTCQPDRCGAPCPAGQVCDTASAMCGPDPCASRNCREGQWCNPADGACEPDPCVGVTCPTDPPGQTCVGGTCNTPVQTATTYVSAGGGGCDSSGGGGSGLALAFGLLARRRRRVVAS